MANWLSNLFSTQKPNKVEEFDILYDIVMEDIEQLTARCIVAETKNVTLCAQITTQQQKIDELTSQLKRYQTGVQP